jgi:hypothetical protein
VPKACADDENGGHAQQLEGTTCHHDKYSSIVICERQHSCDGDRIAGVMAQDADFNCDAQMGVGRACAVLKF